MRVMYIGPFDRVALPALNVEVGRGDTIDVPDGAGMALTAQADWIDADHPDARKAAADIAALHRAIEASVGVDSTAVPAASLEVGGLGQAVIVDQAAPGGKDQAAAGGDTKDGAK